MHLVYRTPQAKLVCQQLANDFPPDAVGRGLWERVYRIEYEHGDPMDILREDGERQAGEAFLSDEFLLTLISLAMMGAVARRADKRMRDLQRRASNNPLRVNDVDDALRDISAIAREAWVDRSTRAEQYEAVLADSVDRGTAVPGGRGMGLQATTTQRVIKGARDAAKYSTNTYFNDKVMPRIEKEIETALQAGHPLDDRVLAEIRAIQDQRLKSTPYWRTVANGAASRAYHYGAVKAGQLGRYTGYEIVATLDERTTDLCQSLHGRRFNVSDAERHMSRVAAAAPEELPTADPWLKLDDITGLTEAQMADIGAIVPPFHANCRTTIKMV